MRLFANAGISLDLSNAVLNRAMLHCENVCSIENMRVRGRLVRTNIPSNTAFRGFGGPQGLFAGEVMFAQAAHSIGCSRDEVLQANFYRSGDMSFYNHPMGEHVPRGELWKQIHLKQN